MILGKRKKFGHVWWVSLNSYFHILNNNTHFLHIFHSHVFQKITNNNSQTKLPNTPSHPFCDFWKNHLCIIISDMTCLKYIIISSMRGIEWIVHLAGMTEKAKRHKRGVIHETHNRDLWNETSGTKKASVRTRNKMMLRKKEEKGDDGEKHI